MDCVLCRAFHNGVDGFCSRAPFEQSDFQSGLAIEALLHCRIISGKLKLMFPLELQSDLVHPVIGETLGDGAHETKKKGQGK
ncbi:putative uncharacterized protein [Desulfovibrio ferrophilus]|uniref:Uncharacterized protein n=1 Tax=Desulfovibrio ferrophilus TaxID=241368 RepID=A0A2Z6AUX4_9BACT|nr:putative uncharacterized protein [Desulfovibrio ferrophilus]